MGNLFYTYYLKTVKICYTCQLYIIEFLIFQFLQSLNSFFSNRECYSLQCLMLGIYTNIRLYLEHKSAELLKETSAAIYLVSVTDNSFHMVTHRVSSSYSKNKPPQEIIPIYKRFVFFNLQVMFVCQPAKFLIFETVLLRRATKSSEGKLVQVSVKKF